MKKKTAKKTKTTLSKKAKLQKKSTSIASSKGKKVPGVVDFLRIPIRLEGVYSRKVSENNFSILSISNSQNLVKVSGVNGYIWDLVDGKTSLQEIYEEVLRVYHPQPKELEKHLKWLFQQFQKEKLVRIR